MLSGVSIQRNARIVRNARKKVRKKVCKNAMNETMARKVPYATNVADVVEGTAVLIIIHNPLHNLMPRNIANSSHLLYE